MIEHPKQHKDDRLAAAFLWRRHPGKLWQTWNERIGAWSVSWPAMPDYTQGDEVITYASTWCEPEES